MKTKIKPRKKSKRAKRPRVEALKKVFKMIGKGEMKFPRKLRRAAIRELDDEKSKFTNKVKTYASGMGKGKGLPDPLKALKNLPSFKTRFIELFDENMKPKDFQMPDLLGGKSHSAKLSKLIFLEKQRFEIPEHEGKAAELKESMKTVELNPDGVGKYFNDKRIELKESGLPMDTANFQGQVLPNSALGKFFPYPPNAFTRQMYVPDSWFMLARAAHAYNYNPMAKAAVDIKTSFIVGAGPKIIIENEALKEAWNEFEKDEDFSETLRTWCSMLSINGEFFSEFLVNPKSGKPTVRSIDPGHVYDIITEPRDIRTVYGYMLMYQTANQIFTQGAKGEVVANSEFIYETIAPDNVMHIKVNVQENEKRGRSDLLCVLWVLQLFEDYVRYKVLRAIVEAAFVWDVKMTGADQDQIDAFLANEDQAFVKPGTTRAHNENVEWKAENASMGAGSNDTTFEMLLAIIAVGMNEPKEYLGSAQGGTRATAITSSEPSVKGFQSRRHKLEVLIMRVVDFLATSKMIDYEPDQVEVSWDEIAPENSSEKIADLYTALDRNTLTKKYVDETVAKILGRTNYDWTDEMQGRLEELTQNSVLQLLDGLLSPKMPVIEKPATGSPVDPSPTATPAPGQPPAATPGQPVPVPATPEKTGPTSISNQDRKEIKGNGQTL